MELENFPVTQRKARKKKERNKNQRKQRNNKMLDLSPNKVSAIS